MMDWFYDKKGFLWGFMPNVNCFLSFDTFEEYAREFREYERKEIA